MTMFSAENRRFCGGYGGGYGEGNFVHGYGGSDLVNDVVMAEDELTVPTDSLNEGGAAESSSKEADDHHHHHHHHHHVTMAMRERDQEWLQLGIGSRQVQHPLTVTTSSPKNNGSSSGLIELELMPTTRALPLQPEFRPPRPATNFGGFSPSFFSPHQEINWAFRPIPISIASPSSSSSSFSSYFPRPFQLYAGVDMAPPAAAAASVDFRVIQPPRRPHSGIWFTLQASQNQEKEPFLPQISKSYLRIKDGRMTIRVVLKYLVNKLSLENESEIEIRCKGQRVQPFLTLQHVRDNIWSSPRDFITLLPNSSTTQHIMVLHYARTNPSN